MVTGYRLLVTGGQNGELWKKMTGVRVLGVKKIGLRSVSKKEKTLVPEALRILYLQRVPQTGLAAIMRTRNQNSLPLTDVVILKNRKLFVCRIRAGIPIGML